MLEIIKKLNKIDNQMVKINRYHFKTNREWLQYKKAIDFLHEIIDELE